MSRRVPSFRVLFGTAGTSVAPEATGDSGEAPGVSAGPEESAVNSRVVERSEKTDTGKYGVIAMRSSHASDASHTLGVRSECPFAEALATGSGDIQDASQLSCVSAREAFRPQRCFVSIASRTSGSACVSL